MNNIWRFLCFLILMSFLCGSGNALMVYQNQTDLIHSSDSIIYGKIVSTQSQWNPDRTGITTTVHIQVADSLKTSNNSDITAGSTVPLSIPGGTVGDTTEWVEDMPVFLQGSNAFVYLIKTQTGQYAVNGLAQGVYTVQTIDMLPEEFAGNTTSVNTTAEFRQAILDSLHGKTVEGKSIDQAGSAMETFAGPTITSVTPSSASAGTDTIITITGSGFGTKASRSSSADVVFTYKTYNLINGWWIYASGNPYPATNANDIVSWTDTRIQVKVPTGTVYDSGGTYPGGACSGFLLVLTDAGSSSNIYPFTVTFSYGKAKWNGPVTYYVNPGSISGAVAAVQNAAASWNNTGSSFRFNYGGTSTSSAFAYDGISLIYFGPESDFSANPNVIAWAHTLSTNGVITESDVEYNTHWTWTTGTASDSTTPFSMNIETITLHEIGHWLFLKDLYGRLPEQGYAGYPSDLSPEKKVMFGINSDAFGNKNLKTLSTAEIAGIRWIYPASHESNIGLYRSGVWILDYNGNFAWDGTPTDKMYGFGAAGDVPVVGDWNHDGFPEIGLYRSAGVWILDYNGNFAWDGTPTDKMYGFGATGDAPVVSGIP
jgi:hypothetical protein